MTRRLCSSTNYRSILQIGLNLNFNKVAEKLTKDFQSRFRSSLPTPEKWTSWLTNFRCGIKSMGSLVGKECSPIVAQRINRTWRLVQLHSKLWSTGGRPLSNRALLSFLLVSLCQSNDNKETGEESILLTELVEHMKDLDFIHELTAATVVCPNCKDRLVVDKKVPNVKYCHCPDSNSAYDKKIKGYAWTPFVETPDLLIWRMPHPDRPGLYMYKVYGYYDDISADDFLDTQLDIQYRKKWDDTVLKLEIVESNKEINQDIIYWEMKWPTMFSNRDYTFARRHLVDTEKQGIVIISKSVPHPSVPERKGIHRVKEYWSVMQVTAVKGLSDRGVEFGLTYFDNPGVSLPTWLNNWAAMTAIPEFLDKQRNAARKKRSNRSSKTISHSNFSEKEKKTIKIPQIGTVIAAEQSESEVLSVDDKSQVTQGQDSLETDNNLTPQKTEILSQFFKERILLNQNPQ